VSDEPRVPIEQVLPGSGLHPLESGWTPLQAFVLIKALDEAGDPVWAFRTTESMNLEELLGALTVQTETLRRKLVRFWEEEDEDNR
jgi:hypothetical protein